jgi:peptide-methionine (S)-S-oxide reductase
MIRGVKEVVSGYAGGDVPNPSYEQVCSGRTGHAEVVQITYDSDVISYRELLEIFFEIHDPTTLNRQGADVGTQYRSAIFYHDDHQRQVAEEVIAEVAGSYKDPIVTEVEPLDAFYEAEVYHQEYYRSHPGQSYCRAVISPKVKKARKKFASQIAE